MGWPLRAASEGPANLTQGAGGTRRREIWGAGVTRDGGAYPDFASKIGRAAEAERRHPC